MENKTEQGVGNYFSPKEILEHISRIQEHFSIDEMPPFRIVGTTPNYSKYKCRKAYFTTLNGLIDFIDVSGDPIIQKQCAEYRNFMQVQIASRGDKPENWVTKEDIAKADNFLEILKSYFESK